MGKVLQMLAGGFASLGTPILRRNYAGFSSTPFTDDRRRLQKDWENVRRDLSKGIEKAKKSYGAETYSR